MFRLGVKLNLPYKDVDEICNRNIRNYQKTYQFLTSWREQSGQQGDLIQIITILQEMNKITIADKIQTTLDSSK